MVSLKEMIGFEVKAEDGSVGRIADFLIDESKWEAGYAVVSVGGMLSGEGLLVSLDDLQLAGSGKVLAASRSRLELKAKAPAGEITKADEGKGLSGDEKPDRPEAFVPDDPNSPWHSLNAMLGRDIAASDGGYGLLDDALVEPVEWRIPYLVGRSNAWKQKPSVLIPTAWVKEIGGAGETINVSVSTAALEREPSFKPASHGRPNS